MGLIKRNSTDNRFDPVLRSKWLGWLTSNSTVDNSDILAELEAINIAISDAGGGSPSTDATHRSPYDFSATYTSSTTLTLSGNPSITDASQIVYIKQIKSDNTSAIFTSGDGTVTITNTGSVLTIYGASTPFAVGDVYEVGINYQEKGYDAGLNMILTMEQSPLYNRYTDPENLVSALDIGAVDDVWIDQGAEISVKGYKSIVLWIDFTVNNSTGNQIRLLMKHTSSGTDEYVLEVPSDYQKTLGNASIKVAYLFPCEGIHYIQVQSKATLIGATEGTFNIDITKEW